MFKTRLLSVLAGAAAVGLLSAGWAYADIVSIGVNFGAVPGSDPDAAVLNLAPTDAAGVVPAANWNNLTAATGTQAGLTAGDGLATTAAVSWAANGFWAADLSGSSPDQILMNGYIDDGVTAGDTTINFTALPFIGDYDLYIYYGSDVNDRTGRAIVGSTITHFATNTNPFDGTFTLATTEDDGAADNGEVALFAGLSGPDLTITVQRVSNNVGVHGVQLVGVIPEPATLGLLCLGGLGLLARRRRPW
jgi:hypothetical protein